ncbi:hypothetical protein BH10PSE17_BH10PSE17_28970 [soil metagenome]
MDDSTIRIFVGCDPNDCDLEQMMVLDHSLRRRASMPVEIEWMQLSHDRSSPWFSAPGAVEAGWRTDRWATPFSGFRWAIPSLCGFTGRAIYMDTDTMALGDIAELWRAPMAHGTVLSARKDGGMNRFGVMLWDCAAARDALPELAKLHSEPGIHRELCRHFVDHPELVEKMDTAFNNIDGEGGPVEAIKVLHYSDMGTQFSHPRALARLEGESQVHWFDGEVLEHPRPDLAAVFEAEFDDAIASGKRPEDYRIAQRFGAFPKKSEARYKGNTVTRGPRGWWKRLFAS